MQYPAFRFHQTDPENNPPRKVQTAEDDEALLATGWGNQPAGNPEAPVATAGVPVASSKAAVFFDTGLRFPAFRFHPNGNQVKVANPEEDAALKAESHHWQDAPCDEATIKAFADGVAAPEAPAAPAGDETSGAGQLKDTPPDQAANILTAEQSINVAKKADANDLAALEKAEKLRGADKARKTVLDAIEARYAELAAAEVSKPQ